MDDELKTKLLKREVINNNPDFIVQNKPEKSNIEFKNEDTNLEKYNENKSIKSGNMDSYTTIEDKLSPNKKKSPNKSNNKNINLNWKRDKEKSENPNLTLCNCYIVPLAILAIISIFFATKEHNAVMVSIPSIKANKFDVIPTYSDVIVKNIRLTHIPPLLSPTSVLPVNKGTRTEHVSMNKDNFVWGVAAPMFSLDWVVEEDKFIYNGGPTFDDDGNLYFSPLNPHEDVYIVCLDAVTGERKWSFKGSGPGGGAPLILPSIDEIGSRTIYISTRTDVYALSSLDGSIIW